MDVSPLFGLRLHTPRLELRLPSRDELVELFRVAEAGIHPRDEMPFGFAWTDDLDLERFLAYHERAVSEWTPERWACNFVTFHGGRVIGTQALQGHDFRSTREVGSGSWLGRPYQGQGLGTEQRAAVLELAFRGLGVRAANTGALWHNRASQRVSEKLGYRFTHEDTTAPRGEPVRHFNYRLDATDWAPPFPIAIEGLEPCLPLFGIAPKA